MRTATICDKLYIIRGIVIMAKMQLKRYVSEEAVKRTLKIDSFRNLSKEKIMEFASMIPYMDKDVALAIINQFPEYVDFGKAAIEQYMQTCGSILEKNNESQIAVIKGYQTILDALSKKLDNENISEIERKAITEDMILVADKIAEADLQNKKFLDRMGTKAMILLAIALGTIGAGIGIHSAVGKGDFLEDKSEEEKKSN